MWYVYVAECCDGSLYCGISKDVLARISKHNAGRGAKYTASRLPIKLLSFSPVSAHRSDALRVEHKFKKLNRKKKLFYIELGLSSFIRECADACR